MHAGLVYEFVRGIVCDCVRGIVYKCPRGTVYQRWDRIWITGLDSGRIVRFSFGPGSGVKNLGKPDPESLIYFSSSRSLCGHFLRKNVGKLRLDR